MNNIVVTGVGSYLPKKIISNNDLPLELDTSDEWIKKEQVLDKDILFQKMN